MKPFETTTDRLKLCSWRESHRDAFAKMNSDPVVMWDFGYVLDRKSSDKKFDRYAEAFRENGYTRWALEDKLGNFLGYTGVLHSGTDHPIGKHDDIGWRLVRSAWGNGYATEAAKAALEDVFIRIRLNEVLSYTAPDNLPSQAVMKRLGLTRCPERDYTAKFETVGEWSGLMWVAKPIEFLP